LALKENTRLYKENEDYSNQIIKLNKKLRGLKNVSIQHVVEKKVLKDNAQTLSNALLKTQNKIEILKRDFQHFSKLIKDKMEFSKEELKVKEKVIRNNNFDIKSQRDEFNNQICECKTMIEKLKNTCASQQMIIDAKDYKYEDMVEEVIFVRIKNEELNNTIFDLRIELHHANNGLNQLKNKILLLENKAMKLNNQLIVNDPKKVSDSFMQVKDSRSILKYHKCEVETKNNLKFEFENSHEDEIGYLCVLWKEIIDDDNKDDIVKKTVSFKYVVFKINPQCSKLKSRIYKILIHTQKRKVPSYQKSIIYVLQLLIRQVNLYFITKFYMLIILSSKIIMVFDGDPRISFKKYFYFNA
jgi:hypothetical protein